MTPRSLWTILLKILGVSILIDAISVIPQSINSALMVGQSFSSETSVSISIAIGFILLTLAGFLFCIRIFLYRTDWLIDKLSLDRHFREEKLEINLPYPAVLQIAVIVTGGLLFINSLPQLCRNIFSFYQQKSIFRENPTTGWVIFYFIETLAGYLLMTNSRRITDWIEKKKQEG